MRSWTFICTVTVIKPADFLQDNRKKGRGYQAPKFLPLKRFGLLFVSLFSWHSALLRICWTTAPPPPPPFCPTWGVRRAGGRSHRLSANRRICPPPAGWNRPIKSERFKPNRYIVNIVGSKVRRNSQTGGLYSQKVTVNYCLHERQPQVWFTVS